jgi:caffeoyl-CoA O-methyltransferase
MKPIVPKEIEDYACAHSAMESEVCRLIREETYRTQEAPQMIVGPLEAAFLKVMIQALRAWRVLEIGTFTGYSALAMAEALPDEGKIITCEVDRDAASMAHTFWDRSPHGKKIEVRIGPALETLATLSGPFDMIFIDADKINYVAYYRRGLELLSAQGVILIDNVLWSGEVLKTGSQDPSTVAIQELNRTVVSDPRVTAVLLTLRDGLFMITRKPGS